MCKEAVRRELREDEEHGRGGELGAKGDPGVERGAADLGGAEAIEGVAVAAHEERDGVVGARGRGGAERLADEGEGGGLEDRV